MGRDWKKATSADPFFFLGCLLEEVPEKREDAKNNNINQNTKSKSFQFGTVNCGAET